MKLDKAIEILTLISTNLKGSLDYDGVEAIKLGIEALKREQEWRHRWPHQSHLPLPGENSIEDSGLSQDRIQKVRESPIGER